MEPKEFDELVRQAKQVGKVLATVYEDVTGEDADLESLVRHYPLLTLGLATGFGFVGGLWIARKSQKPLPPPPPPVAEPRYAALRDMAAKLSRRAQDGSEHEGAGPAEYFEHLVPEGLDRVRNLVPQQIREEATAMAQTWVDTVAEPKLREGVERAVSKASETKVGAYVMRRLKELEGEEHQIPEDTDTPPETPEPPAA